MRAFSCPACRRLAPFESNRCLHCGADHGFDWRLRELLALRPTGPEGELETVGTGEPRPRCANRSLAACNGLAAADGPLCGACALTRTRPSDSDTRGLAQFAVVEQAKRRLVFELGELRLPIEHYRETPGGPRGMAFDLLSSRYESVTTGHDDGIVTLDLAEADDAHREALRVRLAEPYRTVLGHLRHEIGHYYEPILTTDESDLDEVRTLFGDERVDYDEALARHYSVGPPKDWSRRFVSAYATMHPWEDWAETFAHYLHIRDVLQTAAAYGVRVDGPEDVLTADTAPLASDPHEAEGDMQSLLEAWLPLTYALNALNRSMGSEDLYPFVLADGVVEKLALVDRLVRRLPI